MPRKPRLKIGDVVKIIPGSCDCYFCMDASAAGTLFTVMELTTDGPRLEQYDGERGEVDRILYSPAKTLELQTFLSAAVHAIKRQPKRSKRRVTG